MATLTVAKPVAKKDEKATKNLEATTKGEDKNDDENENEDKSEDESKGKNQSGSGLNDGKEIVKLPISSFIRGTQREYSSKPLKHTMVKRILVFKR